MSTQVIQTVFGAETDTGIRMGRNDIMRPFSFGNNWSGIRIGLLANVTQDGTASILGTEWFIGACVWPRSYTTAQAFCIGTQVLVGTGPLSYTAGAGNPYYSTDGGQKPSKKIGATITGTASADRTFTVNTNSPLRRSILILELQRSAAACTVALYYSVNTADYTYANLISYMEIGGVALTTGGVTLTRAGGDAPSVAFVAGEQADLARVDSLNIFWGRETLPLNIYAMAIQRLS